jgi:hypothetical protein
MPARDQVLILRMENGCLQEFDRDACGWRPGPRIQRRFDDAQRLLPRGGRRFREYLNDDALLNYADREFLQAMRGE